MAYTTIDDPSEFFQTALYTGNSGNQSITNDGNSDLQADWIWLKERSSTSSHHVFDSTRGVGDSGKALIPNSTGAEGDDTAFRSFDSNGFTLANTGGFNQNTITNVAWQWKANGGSRTTFTESGNNPAGGHQANITAGFSIVDYVGTGSAGTVSHGLGAEPKVLIVKNRDATTDWAVYHRNASDVGNDSFLELNTNDAVATAGTVWNDTSPSSSVFTVGTNTKTNTDGEKYIAYCFAEKQGYSKIGSYKGNSNADGSFVYLGFKPAFVLVTASNATENWLIVDNKRTQSFNPVDGRLIPNSNGAEETNLTPCDFLSNGIKWRTSDGVWNSSSNTHIYIAFAEHPFVSSKGVPTTAR